MTRLIGVFLMVAVLYGVYMASDEHARTLDSQTELAIRLGLYGVLTLGAGVVIIAGGIDLSIGSVVGLIGVIFGQMLQHGVPPVTAMLVVLCVAPFLGLIHGLLVTWMRLQPFLVTLCGLFIYRGLARWVSPQVTAGFSVLAQPTKTPIDDWIAWFVPSPHPELGAFDKDFQWLRELLVRDTTWHVPHVLVLLLALTAGLALLLHKTVYGRYLFAIGANEQAARYAGIRTDRFKILAYVLCSAFAGLGGVLFHFENRSTAPTTGGTLLELYAITGAVLGGCSLRGGEGNVVGMFLGAAVLPLLRAITFFYGISDELEYVIIGSALLFGTLVDELIKMTPAEREERFRWVISPFRRLAGRSKE